jgi:hypothetical protein
MNSETFGPMTFHTWAKLLQSDRLTIEQTLDFLRARPEFYEWYRAKYMTYLS